MTTPRNLTALLTLYFVCGCASVSKDQQKKEINAKNYIQGYEKGVDGKWPEAPFYSSRLIIQKGVRNLIFILRNPKTERLEFRGVTDFVD